MEFDKELKNFQLHRCYRHIVVVGVAVEGGGGASGRPNDSTC